MPSLISSRRGVLSGLGSVALANGSPADPRFTVSVADFGALPGMNDAGPAIQAAIAKLQRRPGATLYFPYGTYRFAARDGNAMVFNEFDHLTLQGDGATLLFNGVAAPLLMRRCRAPILTGLTFDWERPPFSQGEVIQVSRDRRSLIVRIDGNFPIDGSEKIQRLGTYDRNTRAMIARGIDDGSSVSSVSLVGPQMLQLSLLRPLPFKAGDTVVATHGNGPHVLQMENCDDISIIDVSIHAGPAMAVTLGGCRGALIKRLKVEPKPHSGRLLSTNQDGLHCASCSGAIEVADCTFSGMGDDGINVTELYLAAETGELRNVLTLTGGKFKPAPNYSAPAIGDQLLLVSARTLKPIAESRVQSVDPLGAGQWTVQLTSDTPQLNGEPVFAIAEKGKTTLQVSRCVFPGNRARGILAHRDVVIEDCFFQNQSHSAILLAPDMFWQEGPAVEAATIRRNQIVNVNLLERARGAIWIAAFLSPEGQQKEITIGLVNRNITIEDNTFLRPNGPAVAVTATRDVRITGNRIEQAASVAFLLEDVEAVELGENHCNPPARIQADPSSIKEISVRHNIGLQGWLR